MVDSAPPYIPIVLGTPREGRRTEKVARYLLRRLESREDVVTNLVDVRDVKLPARGPDRRNPPATWHDTATRADGFLIVTPEYNRGYPGALKNLLDCLYDEYAHKAAGICGVSRGSFGASRAISALLPVLRTLGLVTIRRDLFVPNAADAFDDEGNPREAAMERRANAFTDELIWMARALRTARQTTDTH